MAMASFYCGYQPMQNETQKCRQMKTNCTQRQYLTPGAAFSTHCGHWKMDSHVWWCEESSVNMEGTSSPFWYLNTNAVVQPILGHSLFNNLLSYAPVKPIDSSHQCIYSEIWTQNCWWETPASFLYWERVCQRACQRPSESNCKRWCVTEHGWDNILVSVNQGM